MFLHHLRLDFIKNTIINAFKNAFFSTLTGVTIVETWQNTYIFSSPIWIKTSANMHTCKWILNLIFDN